MIKVAKIINTHGLKGECKMYLYTDDAFSRFKTGNQLQLDSGQAITIRSFRMQKGFGYATFEGITSIEQAEALKQGILWIDEKELPALEKGHYYYFELMGCRVENTDKEELGVVTDILETGPHIVLRVAKENTSFLVPYVPAFIQSVDVDQKIIVIKEMQGLR